MKTRYQENKKTKEAAASRKRKLEEERAKTLFVRKDKVIRRNDMIVDQAANKIKLEPEENLDPVVKQEVEMVEVDQVDSHSSDTITLCGGVSSRTSERTDIPSSSSSVLTQPNIATPHVTLGTEKEKSNEKTIAVINQALIEKISRLETQLESQVETTSTVKLQLDNTKKLLVEKDKQLSSVVDTCATLRLELEEKDKQLSSEVKTSSSLRLQLAKVEELLREKNAEIRRPRQLQPDTSRSNQGTEYNARDIVTVGQGEKVVTLFKDVLKILLQQEGENNGVNWKRNMILLKPCRLVCQSWMQSVDQILEEDPSHLALTEDNTPLASSKKYKAPCPLILSIGNLKACSSVVQRTMSIVHQQEEGGNSNYNPVPSRHVMMEIMHVDNFLQKWNTYCNLATKYLQLFGKQVWYLTLSIDDQCGVGLKLIEFTYVLFGLPNLFRLVPNCKSLTIEIPAPPPAMDFYFEDEDDGLPLLMKQIPFPRLEHLITFQCAWYSPHFHTILKNSYQQIQRLGFMDYPNFHSPHSRIPQIDFPKLTELMWNLRGQRSWGMFERVSWKLEKLSIVGRDLPPISRLLDELAKFRDTLQILTLDLDTFTRHGSIVVKGKLDLPRLRVLKIVDGRWEPLSWEKIVTPAQLPNLEKFSMEYFHIKSKPPAKEFLEYVNNFESKMKWKMLRKLENVRLIVTVGNKHKRVGVQKVFLRRRFGMPSVRFDVAEIS